jgi:curved DNA-binding protein CbpA
MNYYELLGVYPDASMEDIKKAYRTKANIHHPDKGGNAETFKDVKKAYETLYNDVKRKNYNNQFGYTFNQYKQTESRYDTDSFFRDQYTQTTASNVRPQTIAEIRAMAANQYGKGVNKDAANKYGFGKFCS